MAQYTKKAILQTFQDMLQKNPFDKITVSALVANCEISPNTFYYHFRDIYDLLETWLQIKLKKYFADAMEEMPWPEALKVLLRDMRENSALVYHLYESLSRERIERYIFESTDDTFYRIVRQEAGDTSLPETVLREIAEYNSYAILGFFLKFLWMEMEGDIEEGVDRIAYILKKNVQWTVKTWNE